MKRFVPAALLLAVGLLGGSAATVAAIRVSRSPGNLLYNLRARITTPASEVSWLERKYGPQRQSLGSEEWILRDFFRGRRDGVFVDVGAADYKLYSNTWYLETQLGWSGVAIDAQADYGAGYERSRPRTKFLNLFVTDRSQGYAHLFLSEGRGASSFSREFTQLHGAVTGSIDVPTTTLNEVLDGVGIQAFDFLSLDIELAEPKALAGFDIVRFKPALACVEAHPQVRQEILDYFVKNGYVVLGKYLSVDDLNLWFAPLGTRVEPFPFHSHH